jgi:HK97 family phage major capsid protein
VGQARRDTTAPQLRAATLGFRGQSHGDHPQITRSPILTATCKFKDISGDYTWRGALDGVTSTVLGRPAELDENIPAVGAGSLPIAFGDWKTGRTTVDPVGIKVPQASYTNMPDVGSMLAAALVVT